MPLLMTCLDECFRIGGGATAISARLGADWPLPGSLNLEQARSDTFLPKCGNSFSDKLFCPELLHVSG